ncbi:MAG: hypothetical protein KGL94_13595 [Acidobacteriota bacterium]|nr:hypothetical protein [Acidobacteriota bacterium]
MTLPGPPLPAPLQTLRLWRDPAGFLGRCRREFGDAFALQLWPIGGVAVVASPELIVQLVLTPRDDLHTGEATRRVLPILGERSLPALDGAEHAEEGVCCCRSSAAGGLPRTPRRSRPPSPPNSPAGRVGSRCAPCRTCARSRSRSRPS